MGYLGNQITTVFPTSISVDTATISSDVNISDKIVHDGDTNTAMRFPSADTISFETGGSERAKVDSSGNLLVGKTDTTFATTGVRIADGFAELTNANDGSLTLHRTGSHGYIQRLYKDSTLVGSIGSDSGKLYVDSNGTNLVLKVGGTAYINLDNLRLYPQTDNAYDLGLSSNRFDDIFATNGTIQTSDRNEKQDIEELSEAEQRVAVVAKGLMRKFRWKDKVAEKGDNARTHFGIIAQDLQDAFTAEGLNAGNYAMFTSTTWFEKEITVDAVEADEENGIEAQDAYTYIDTKEEATEGYTERTRLGVRYNQLLAFIISAI
jgi:hypothetical protein